MSLKKTIAELIKTDTGKDTAVVFVGTCINVLASGTFLILSTRLLGLSNYGLFSTIVATGVIAVRLSGLGVETGILRFANKRSSTQNVILSTALKSYLFFGTAIAVIGFFASPSLAALLDHPEITFLLRIAFAFTIFFHLTSLFVAGLQARHEFLKSMIPLVANNISRVVLILIGSYFFVINLQILTIIYFSVTIISTITGKIFLPIKIEKIDASLAKDFFKFNIWVALALILASIPFDNYFILKFAGPVQTGLYAAPFKVLTFAHEFGGNFTRVLASRFSTFDTKEKIIDFSKKVSFLVGLFILGIFLLILIADLIIPTLFGQEYTDSINILKILAIGFIFFFAATIPSSIILYNFGKSKISFLITAIKYILFVILLAILVPSHKAIGGAIAFSLAEFFAFILMILYVALNLNNMPSAHRNNS